MRRELSKSLRYWRGGLGVARLLFTALFLLSGMMVALAGDAAILSKEGSYIRTNWSGDVEIMLRLNREVPFRVSHAVTPDRLRIDLKNTILPKAIGEIFLSSRKTTKLRVGYAPDNHARLVLMLGKPLRVAQARTEHLPDGVALHIRLRETDREQFDQTAIAVEAREPVLTEAPSAGRPVIVLDPGHGGRDPGAQHLGVSEKDIVLDFTRYLQRELQQLRHFDVILTRRDDRFLFLDQRLRVARQQGADLFISVHADAIDRGQASGTAIYVLSGGAQSKAAALFAKRENGADRVAGANLRGQTGDVTEVLASLAQPATAARSLSFAKALQQELENNLGRARRISVQSADFRVLQAPETPSILIELGFISNPQELALVRSPDWQRRFAKALVQSVMAWRRTDMQRQKNILK